MNTKGTNLFNNRSLERFTDNVIFNCDTYKHSHVLFMEDNTSYNMLYLEPRSGGVFDVAVPFGYQYILIKEFSQRITAAMVDQASWVLALHGVPFNREAFDRIVNDHDGYFPIKMSAVKEGTPVPIGNVLLTIESTCEDFNMAVFCSMVETKIMRSWYPTTIVSLGRAYKRTLTNYMNQTSDIQSDATFTGSPDNADGKLIDFGARGVTVKEQAEIGGAGHGINFSGSDNLMGMAALMEFYGDPSANERSVPMFSICATEHTITIPYGEKRELEFFDNIISDLLPKVGIASVVIDTWDTESAIRKVATLREKIEANGVFVFRPDSGDPVESTEMVITLLDELFGSTVNSKGYKVLNPCARVLQGDGIDLKTMDDILANLKQLGFSAENINFGSGGGLLQNNITRDSMRFAIKGCHTIVDGVGKDIQKIPATDPTKASKAGILRLVKDTITGNFRTINQHDVATVTEIDMLEPIYENGRLLRWQTYDEIRDLAGAEA